MQCDEVQRIADLYIDNLLDEESMSAVKRHLFICPTCNHDIETVLTTISLIRSQVQPEQLSPSFKERTTAMLLDKLRDHLHPSQPALSAIQWPLPID